MSAGDSGSKTISAASSGAPPDGLSCTLPAAALPARIAEIRAIGADALIDAVSERELRFRADARTRRRLEAIVAAEARCCAQVEMRLSEGDDGELRLTLRGPGSQAFHTAFTGG